MTEQDLYRALADFTRFSVSSNQELFYSPLSRSTHLLPAAKARFVESCQSFDSLDRHAQRLCNQFNIASEKFPAVRQQLMELVDAGLLVSQKQLLERVISGSRQATEQARITTVAIPTRNRSESLVRCLESYAECRRKYDRADLKFLVVDQTDQEDARRRNQHALEKLKSEFEFDLSYADPGVIKKFASRLAEVSGVDPDIVNFAMLNDENLPISTGCSRNYILLSTVGEVILQVDDDTVCKVARSPEAASGLTFTSEYDPTRFSFPSPEQMNSLEDSLTDDDFFAMHEQLLAKSFAQCIEENSGIVSIAKMDAAFFRRLEKGGGCVSVTSAGLLGDSGMSGSSYLLTLKGAARENLVRSEIDYRHALTSHQVARAAANLTISSGSLTMGYSLGLDNRQNLPPFFPVLRAEDIAFGELLCLSASGGYVGYLPSVLSHKPQEKRQFSTEDMVKRASHLRTCDIVQILIQSFTADLNRHATKDFASLGNFLYEWGSAPVADFEEMLKLVLTRMASLKLLYMEHHLKTHNNLPKYWSDDMQLCMTALKNRLSERSYVVGSDLMATNEYEHALAIQQRLVRRFGQLLQAWSTLQKSARELE